LKTSSGQSSVSFEPQRVIGFGEGASVCLLLVSAVVVPNAISSIAAAMNSFVMQEVLVSMGSIRKMGTSFYFYFFPFFGNVGVDHPTLIPLKWTNDERCMIWKNHGISSIYMQEGHTASKCC